MLRDIINQQSLVTCEPDAKVADVARLMAERDVGAVLVLNNGRPHGIITDRDICVGVVGKNLDVNDTTIENVMTESLETVRDTDGFFDCIQKMKDAKVRRMPVVDEAGKAVGIVSFGDLLAILSKEFVLLTATTTPLEEDKSVGKIKAA